MKVKLALASLIVCFSANHCFAADPTPILVTSWEDGSYKMDKKMGEAISKKAAALFAKRLNDSGKWDVQERDKQLAGGQTKLRSAKIMLAPVITISPPKNAAGEKYLSGKIDEITDFTKNKKSATVRIDMAKVTGGNEQRSRIDIDIKVINPDNVEIISALHTEFDHQTPMEMPATPADLDNEKFAGTEFGKGLEKAVDQAVAEFNTKAADNKSSIGLFLEAAP